MYQNLVDEMKDSMKPFLNVAEIQSQTAQKLVRQQMDLMGECLELGTRQTDALRDSKDFTAFFRIPMDASREIGEKLMNSAARQWDTLVEAHDAFNGVVESAVQKDFGKQTA